MSFKILLQYLNHIKVHSKTSSNSCFLTLPTLQDWQGEKRKGKTYKVEGHHCDQSRYKLIHRKSSIYGSWFNNDSKLWQLWTKWLMIHSHISNCCTTLAVTWLQFRHLTTSLYLQPVAVSCNYVIMICDLFFANFWQKMPIGEVGFTYWLCKLL